MQIIRWKNLVLIAGIQVVIKYYLMPLFSIPDVLPTLDFIFLVLASLFIAAGGYIINDVYDVEADRINKPDKLWLSYGNIKRAFFVYRIVSIIGILLGMLISIKQAKLAYSLLFIIPVILLQVYAIKFKKILFVGNLLISLLVAYSVLILVFFETNIMLSEKDNSLHLVYVIWVLAFFSFGINLLREIVKDAEDIIGDTAIGAVSIPIRFGKRITLLVLKGISILLMSIIVVICLSIFDEQPLLVLYLVFVVLLSLMLFVFQLNKIVKTDDYSKLSTFLKLTMLIGIIAVFMIRPL